VYLLASHSDGRAKIQPERKVLLRILGFKKVEIKENRQNYIVGRFHPFLERVEV
jgi:hypothetical protein